MFRQLATNVIRQNVTDEAPNQRLQLTGGTRE